VKIYIFEKSGRRAEVDAPTKKAAWQKVKEVFKRMKNEDSVLDAITERNTSKMEKSRDLNAD
tara:strand:- start:51 stop:236 length:186 start_codon:yes stop_codon:yes gene_type:complete